jgi:hypothetical protein
MNVTALDIPEVLLIGLRVFGDERGFFFETYNQGARSQKQGIPAMFVQDNHSRSAVTCCADSTTRRGKYRQSSFESSLARYLTSPWTFASFLQASASMWAQRSQPESQDALDFVRFRAQLPGAAGACRVHVQGYGLLGR